MHAINRACCYGTPCIAAHRAIIAMAMGRPKAELVLSEAEHAQLTSIARSRSMPAALTQRAGWRTWLQIFPRSELFPRDVKNGRTTLDECCRRSILSPLCGC